MVLFYRLLDKFCLITFLLGGYMEVIRITGSKKRILERYKGQNEIPWIRIKYLDEYRTEVTMLESEFERLYGKAS